MYFNSTILLKNYINFKENKMSQLFPEYDKKYLEIMIQAHDHSSIRRFLTEKESDLIAIFNAGMKDEVTKKIIDKSGFFMGSFEQHEKKGKPLTFESMYGESVFQNFKAEDGSTNDELKREVKSEIEGIVEHILCTAIEDDESISFDLRGLSQEKFDDICENSDRLKTINDKTDRVTSDYELLRSEYFSRLSPQENAIDGKEEELDQIDQLIDNKINDIAAIDKTLDNASQFEDHLFSKIVDDYSEILKSSDNHELFRIISETETLKDDEIFDEITNILEYKSELRREIEGLVLSFNQYNSASREIRRIEDRIRVNGWSRTGHRFSGLDVHHLINGIKNEGMGAAKTLNLLSISHTPPPRRRTSIDIPQSTFSTSSSFGGSSTFTTTNSF